MKPFNPNDEHRQWMLRQGFDLRIITVDRENGRVTQVAYEYIGRDGTDAVAEARSVYRDVPARDDTPLDE